MLELENQGEQVAKTLGRHRTPHTHTHIHTHSGQIAKSGTHGKHKGPDIFEGIR